VSPKQCKNLYKSLNDLVFHLGETKITLKPAGYTYSMPDSNDCFIGISPTDNKDFNYRLGTIFLRNFYVALDYENNYIGFAQNIDMWDESTKFEGSSSNPDEGIPLYIVLIFVALACWALGLFILTAYLSKK